MKHSLTIAWIIGALLFCPLVSAQYSAQLYPAETILKGTAQIFGNVGIYDHAKTLVAGYRYGIGGYTDGAVKLGFADFDHGGDDGLILGGDIKYQVMELRIQDPIDLSVGALMETVLGTGTGNISLGGFVVGSRYIALTKTMNLWPYGRLVARWDHFGSNDEFNIGFNAGAALDINKDLRASAEFQFDDQFGFILGILFGI
jgi:hypothetical protein